MVTTHNRCLEVVVYFCALAHVTHCCSTAEYWVGIIARPSPRCECLEMCCGRWLLDLFGRYKLNWEYTSAAISQFAVMHITANCVECHSLLCCISQFAVLLITISNNLLWCISQFAVLHSTVGCVAYHSLCCICISEFAVLQIKACCIAYYSFLVLHIKVCCVVCCFGKQTDYPHFQLQSPPVST